MRHAKCPLLEPSLHSTLCSTIRYLLEKQSTFLIILFKLHHSPEGRLKWKYSQFHVADIVVRVKYNVCSHVQLFTNLCMFEKKSILFSLFLVFTQNSLKEIGVRRQGFCYLWQPFVITWLAGEFKYVLHKGNPSINSIWGKGFGSNSSMSIQFQFAFKENKRCDLLNWLMHIFWPWYSFFDLRGSASGWLM